MQTSLAVVKPAQQQEYHRLEDSFLKLFFESKMEHTSEAALVKQRNELEMQANKILDSLAASTPSAGKGLPDFVHNLAFNLYNCERPVRLQGCLILFKWAATKYSFETNIRHFRFFFKEMADCPRNREISDSVTTASMLASGRDDCVFDEDEITPDVLRIKDIIVRVNNSQRAFFRMMVEESPKNADAKKILATIFKSIADDKAHNRGNDFFGFIKKFFDEAISFGKDFAAMLPFFTEVFGEIFGKVPSIKYFKDENEYAKYSLQILGAKELKPGPALTYTCNYIIVFRHFGCPQILYDPMMMFNLALRGADQLPDSIKFFLDEMAVARKNAVLKKMDALIKADPQFQDPALDRVTDSWVGTWPKCRNFGKYLNDFRQFLNESESDPRQLISMLATPCRDSGSDLDTYRKTIERIERLPGFYEILQDMLCQLPNTQVSKFLLISDKVGFFSDRTVQLVLAYYNNDDDKGIRNQQSVSPGSWKRS